MYRLDALADRLTYGSTPAAGGRPESVKNVNVGGVAAALHRGDCLSVLKVLRPGTVDLVLVDLPYGVTQNKWDSVIPLEPLWQQLHRVAKKDASFVFTATQPFTSLLVLSNPDEFRYDLVWEKTICSGQLNVKRQPLRAHESVLVFSRGKPAYNEQRLPGEPYSIKRKAKFEGPGYGAQRDSEKQNDGFRHARSVIRVSNPRIKGGHPTQKPIELMRWLVRTYSNSNAVVLDCCMGAGTTGVAAIEESRNFVGIELEDKYFQMAAERIVQCGPPTS